MLPYGDGCLFTSYTMLGIGARMRTIEGVFIPAHTRRSGVAAGGTGPHQGTWAAQGRLAAIALRTAYVSCMHACHAWAVDHHRRPAMLADTSPLVVGAVACRAAPSILMLLHPIRPLCCFFTVRRTTTGDGAF